MVIYKSFSNCFFENGPPILISVNGFIKVGIWYRLGLLIRVNFNVRRDTFLQEIRLIYRRTKRIKRKLSLKFFCTFYGDLVYLKSSVEKAYHQVFIGMFSHCILNIAYSDVV